MHSNLHRCGSRGGVSPSTGVGVGGGGGGGKPITVEQVLIIQHSNQITCHSKTHKKKKRTIFLNFLQSLEDVRHLSFPVPFHLGLPVPSLIDMKHGSCQGITLFLEPKWGGSCFFLKPLGLFKVASCCGLSCLGCQSFPLASL